MSDTKNSQSPKTPSHIAYHVRDREGGKAFWTRIGVAFAHNRAGSDARPQPKGFTP